MAYLRIVDYAETEVTRVADDHDEWDQPDFDTSHDIRGYVIVGENNYYDVQTKYDPIKGQPLWLLVVHYSTGDSFHHEEGLVAFVDVYANILIAHENLQILNQISNDSYISSVKLKLDTQEWYDYDVGSFTGYFESIQKIEILELHEYDEES